jgi:hypothetical protein
LPDAKYKETFTILPCFELSVLLFQMSIKHYGEMAFSCPVCSLTVDPTEEFVPLSSGYKPKIR